MMTMNKKTIQIFTFFTLSLTLFINPRSSSSLETDTMTSTTTLSDSDTIVSRRRSYTLGFFSSPPNSSNRYLGIFYTVSPTTIVWVANRDNPLHNTLGTLTLTDNGNLSLLDSSTNRTLWSTNVTLTDKKVNNNATLQLLDTGNLVLRAGPTLWESFSYPSNTFLPTMRIIDHTKTGRKVVVSSWRNETDPGPGRFTAGLEAHEVPQIFTWRADDGRRPHWRSGPWNGQILIGVQDMYSPYLDGFSVVNEEGRSTTYFTAPEARFFMRITLNSSGALEQSLWNEQTRRWDVTWVAPQSECDVYGKCGPYGRCDERGKPICSCLRGFEPAEVEEWGRGNWTGGCRRRRELGCGGGDGFFRLGFVKVPDFAERFPGRRGEDCRVRCSGNCSCVAYAHDPNIGCMLWSRSLVDVQQFNGVGTDLYIRLPASELDDDHKDRRLVAIIIPVVVGFTVICVSILVAWCWIVKRKGDRTKGVEKTSEARRTFSPDSTAILLKDTESDKVNIEELPLFTFDTLSNATDGFNESALLGKGGFGPVYKGILSNGREIAVKRLSAASTQGVEEFTNEVVVISKLQHRNLVRLLGCCVEREEKMLVYEYMPNKSLDVCLFGQENASRKVLDWKKRSSIMEGVGRGLLYLHRDSRLRIIHRDLKPSNVLLDEDWNPKISDFGMARIFGGNQDHGDTARVVGTYGYMAPEYAMEGRFSEKSDVYSFGVLMLEIIKGEKNTHYYNQEWSLSLIGCAWKLWSEGNGSDFADDFIVESSGFQTDVVRCIQIALLCVQEFPEDRPAIQTVLSMLCGEIVDLPEPEQPVFAEKWHGPNQSTGQFGYSTNGLTLTVLDGR